MKMTITRRAALALLPGLAAGQAADPQLFLQAIGNDGSAARRALDSLAPQWRDAYTIILLELTRPFVRDRPGDSPDTSSAASMVRNRIFEFLGSRTKKRFGHDVKAWTRWAWSLPYAPHPEYAELKGFAYSKIDSRMAEFFPQGVRSNTRLDQVEWVAFASTAFRRS